MKRLIATGLLGTTLLCLSVPTLAQEARERGRGEGRRDAAEMRRGSDREVGRNDRGRESRNDAAPQIQAPPQAQQQRAAPDMQGGAARETRWRGDNAAERGRGDDLRVQRSYAPRPGVAQTNDGANNGAVIPVSRTQQNWSGDRSRDNGRGDGGAQRPRNGDGDGRSGSDRGRDDSNRDRNWSGRDDNSRTDRYRDGRNNDGWNDRDRDRRNDNWSDRNRNDRDWRYTPGRRVENRWSGYRPWSNDWRRDRRYDWQDWRRAHRSAYRLPTYYAPYGWNRGYSRFSIGIYLNSILFTSSYWIDDAYSYRLPPAYGPLRWVRYYNDALLVDVRDGYVVDVVYDVFW